MHRINAFNHMQIARLQIRTCHCQNHVWFLVMDYLASEIKRNSKPKIGHKHAHHIIMNNRVLTTIMHFYNCLLSYKCYEIVQ